MSKRSIYLDGSVTSISMEDAFWNELDRYAASRGRGWAEVVRDWLVAGPPSDNRSASIKETILQLLRSEVDQVKTESHAEKTVWQVRIPSAKAPLRIETVSPRIIVGRESPANMVIEDDEVSRRHLMLVSDGAQWWLIDLKSKNGTFRAGKRVSFAEISPGNEFVIGKSKIKLVGIS